MAAAALPGVRRRGFLFLLDLLPLALFSGLFWLLGFAAFLLLIPRCVRLADLAANLERLRAEYARTARRARAMEDVLLPEIDATLAAIDTALEELEREEAVRVRRTVG